jgi:hypothetical protein
LEELQDNVIRRKVNFANGTVEGALISNVLNNQLDDGTVLAGTATPKSSKQASATTSTFTTEGAGLSNDLEYSVCA